MKRSLAVVTLFSLLVVLCPRRADAQTFFYEYVAKFVCGKSSGKVLGHGNYLTAINVHCSSLKPAMIMKTFAVALPGETEGPVSKAVRDTLWKDQAFEIDCADIRGHLKISDSSFIKGFVILRSYVELDVVALYTVEGVTNEAPSMCIERVPARKRSGSIY